MSTFDIIRAWKDAEYRKSLSIEEQRLLPEHPAGTVELTEAELGMAVAGDALSADPGAVPVADAGTNMDLTAGCCAPLCGIWTCCCNIMFD